MTSPNEVSKVQADREVLITRLFDAPRELVFQAWTDPKHLTRWYAPGDCTINIHKFDFRPGGSFQHTLRTSSGYECPCAGTYREVVAPERIVYTVFLCDQNGDPIEPVEAGKDTDWPRETTITVTFTEHEGKTKLTLHQTVLESIAKRTGAYPSWLEMLDRLDSLVAEQTS